MAEQNADVEGKVRNFYDQKGWTANEGGDTVDAQLWEDLRPCAARYISTCRRKILKYLPPRGEKILDAASGPIQYPEYLEYSAHFKTRVCVDVSERALEQAKQKIGAHGEFHLASILALPFANDSFDAAVSLHTIYHIDQAEQEKAVRELLRVTKPGAPLIVVYSNPNKFLSLLKRPFVSKKKDQSSLLYFLAHPIMWWNRFEDVAQVEALPWRSLTAQDAKRLVPGNKWGEKVFDLTLAFEEKYPSLALKFGAYPMFILRKRRASK